MTPKRRRKRRDRDPIADYREWADNRYNPGHWLGGNVPPSIRNLWSPKDRRWVASMYLSGCAIGLGIVLWNAPGADWDSVIPVVLVLVAMLIPGVLLLFVKDAQDRDSD